MKLELKINGPVMMVANEGTRHAFNIHKVTLKGGPMDRHQTLAGNTTELELNGHRYVLNADGDFVYSPEPKAENN
jgi:hypothetical protein